MRRKPLYYLVTVIVLFGFFGATACSESVSIPGTTPASLTPVEEPESSEPASVPTTTPVPDLTLKPWESVPPQPKPKEITLDDSISIFRIHSELPSGFIGGTASGTAATSELLGIGSIPIYFTEGKVLQESPWCQIQCVLWIVDNDIAQEVSADDVLKECDLEGHTVDLGESIEAMLYGGKCSGLDFLAFKYGRVFVLINSWYTHPREDCISLVDLGKVIALRLKEYSQ